MDHILLDVVYRLNFMDITRRDVVPQTRASKRRLSTTNFNSISSRTKRFAGLSVPNSITLSSAEPMRNDYPNSDVENNCANDVLHDIKIVYPPENEYNTDGFWNIEVSPVCDIADEGCSITNHNDPSSGCFRNTIVNTKLHDVPIVHDLQNADNIDGFWNIEVSPISDTAMDERCSAIREYSDIGDPVHSCVHCTTLFWSAEKLASSTKKEPIYSGCCISSKIKLPKMKEPLKILWNLIFGKNELSNHFQEHIRWFNNMFCFTSMGGTIDSTINNRNSPPTFRMHGQNYHRIGSLLPMDGKPPKFAQLYIYDTENEINNRLHAMRSDNVGSPLDSEIVERILHMLDENNVLVKSFRMTREKIMEAGTSEVKLKLIGRRNSDARLYNLPSVSEVAALIVGDFNASMEDRDIIIETQTGLLQRITQLHPSYLLLQYPLLFPYGEDGYTKDISFSEPSTYSHRSSITFREFFSYRLHDRENQISTILSVRRLFQQFVVDLYTMIESSRLSYLRNNQKKLRADMYKGLKEALLRGETNPNKHGQRIILPSTFTGGARYMIQNYQDAMAICGWAGYPDLFITFTCNPKWPEIVRYVKKRGLDSHDRPDIISRVFKIKLENLMNDLRKNQHFGSVKAVVYTIEFQKRGLPRARILLFLNANEKHKSPTDIDKIITAEIPDRELEPHYYKCVQAHMMHGPCGVANQRSPCMSNGRCTKFFPKNFNNTTCLDDDGYPIYRCRDDGRFIVRKGIPLDKRYVVPHNRDLLIKYQAHINVEWCKQSRSIKYLFKYINKGHDRVTAAFYEKNGDEATDRECDEIQMYYDCRYISPCEACWRIFSFQINFKNPHVERLSFHLPGEQTVIFSENDQIDHLLNRPTAKQSMFLAWMEANKNYPDARELTYSEFPTKFVWRKRKWKPRTKRYAIGRVFYVPPGTGEKYYLRCLLNIVRGPRNYEEIRCINGIQYNTFRDAVYSLELLDDDKEYIDGITEASQWASAHCLRKLFATLLWSNSMSQPEIVWEKCWQYLSDDVLHKQRIMLSNRDLILDDQHVKSYALAEIEKLLMTLGRSLHDYSSIPYPDTHFFQNHQNMLILDELRYDQSTLEQDYIVFLQTCTDEQRRIHDTILDTCRSNSGGLFFVHGYGGTGKTFVWKGLSASLRRKGKIVINVASSGIASLLLPCGRTTHSRFRIPINVTEDSICNIKADSPLAQLIIKAKLIIWDEAPMTHKFCFEALDKSLRDIMRFHNPTNCTYPFGGKVVVLGGDFRQILPVIAKISRQDIVHATINSSYLWENCTILKLTKNMRVHRADTTAESTELSLFTDWIASIGDGTAGDPNDGEAMIDIPKDMLLNYSEDPIAAIVEYVYLRNNKITTDADFLQERAILAPTLDIVDSINQYIISLSDGEGHTYLSSDTICRSTGYSSIFQNIHTPEFLNTIKCSGIPNHALFLKVGTLVMLLRNIDHANGLCNGTRLVITRLGSHVLEAKILTGQNAGDRVLIPRITLTQSDETLPFRFQRCQFSLIISYAMTINKSQGQSLNCVGLLLKKPVFSHGQLYVALSRVTNRDGLKIVICDSEDPNSTRTRNVVFKEIFQNT